MAYKKLGGSKGWADRECARKIKEVSDRIIQDKGNAVVGVPGGSSPLGIFEELKEEDIDWGNISIYLVDERWVPIEDPDSNYKQFMEELGNYLVDEGKIEPESIHSFDYEKGVDDYQRQLGRDGGRIDIALLGVGEDGHIASLFPNHPSLDSDEPGYIEVHDSPKPPSRRVSASRGLIEKSDTAILLFYGERKRGALEEYEDSLKSWRECPAKIADEAENTYVFTDLSR